MGFFLFGWLVWVFCVCVFYGILAAENIFSFKKNQKFQFPNYFSTFLSILLERHYPGSKW